MNTIETGDKFGVTFCDRIPLVIEKRLGTTVWDSDDKLYLDFTSGWGVACLGHSHPIITDALITQITKIMQSPNAGFTYLPARANALLELSKVLPKNMDKSYFVNSGAQANDAAINLARKISGRSKVISTLSSFHGRTFNTLTVSTGKENGDRYLPITNNSFFVEFGNIAAI
jgi:acetylornithine/N-succinyldiaminopimelate aminotransferase